MNISPTSNYNPHKSLPEFDIKTMPTHIDFLLDDASQDIAQMVSVWTNLGHTFGLWAHFGNESSPSRLRDLIVHDVGASRTFVHDFASCLDVFRICLSYFKYMF